MNNIESFIRITLTKEENKELDRELEQLMKGNPKVKIDTTRIDNKVKE